MFKAFLIKYGEIAIKGKNRYLFEDALLAQIRHALKEADGSFRVTKEQGRMYVEAGPEDISSAFHGIECPAGRPDSGQLSGNAGKCT